VYQRGDGQLTVYFLRRRYADKGWICDDAARRECLCNQSFLSEKKEYDSRKWHIHHGHAMFMLSLSLSAVMIGTVGYYLEKLAKYQYF
jgi:hypothetical protein